MASSFSGLVLTDVTSGGGGGTSAATALA